VQDQTIDKQSQKDEEVVRIVARLKTEIIERKWAEKKSRDALDYAESIIDSVKHPLVVLDEETKVISANLAFYDLFTLTPGVVLGQAFCSLADGFFNLEQMKTIIMGSPTRTPKVLEVDQEFPIIGRKFLKLGLQNLQYNVRHLRFSLLTIEDITDSKIAEAKLRKALKEKSALIKEVHHRVKNNLQILSSLLSLQISTLDNENQKRVLEDGLSRVLAMSAVHESLSESGSYELVDLTGPIERIVAGVDSIYDDGVMCSLDIRNVDVDIDTASVVCLVVNEIVTNAHKHAFTEDANRPKRISIEANIQDDKVELVVSDNGRGMKGKIDSDLNTTLGFTLIRNLVENQLHGSWKMKDFGGLVHLISIPIDAKQRQPKREPSH